MKKIMLWMSLVSICISSDIQIKQLKDKEDVFPYVISNTQPNIAENINSRLQLEYLNIVPNTYKKTPFENKRAIYFNHYEEKKSSKVLSIAITGEGCGAYCETFTNYHNFLLSDGKEIKAKDLFSKDGKEVIGDMLHRKISTEIKAFLKDIKPGNGLIENEENEQIQMYQRCLEKEWKGKISDYTKFAIKTDKITFFTGRCSNHAMRALDDLGEFSNTLDKKILMPHMSMFGKSLFKKNETKMLNVPRGLFNGTLGKKYTIKLFISKIYDDGSVNASYWYTNYNKPIELNGKYKNGKFEFKVFEYEEESDNSSVLETLSLEYSKHSLKGTWTLLSNGKTLPILLEEMN